jgi:hypothetical protein
MRPFFAITEALIEKEERNCLRKCSDKGKAGCSVAIILQWEGWEVMRRLFQEHTR